MIPKLHRLVNTFFEIVHAVMSGHFNELHEIDPQTISFFCDGFRPHNPGFPWFPEIPKIPYFGHFFTSCGEIRRFTASENAYFQTA